MILASNETAIGARSCTASRRERKGRAVPDYPVSKIVTRIQSAGDFGRPTMKLATEPVVDLTAALRVSLAENA
jgi:hypothetical protein